MQKKLNRIYDGHMQALFILDVLAGVFCLLYRQA